MPQLDRRLFVFSGVSFVLACTNGGDTGETQPPTDDTGETGGDSGDTAADLFVMVVGEDHLIFDDAGNTYTLDPHDHSIHAPDWTLQESPEQGLNLPWELVVAEGIVYVLLRGSGIVGLLDQATGEVLGGIAELEIGNLHHPYDLVIGPDGVLYVADSMNHRVVTLDFVNEQVGHFGEHGVDDEHHLNLPRGMAFDPEGNLHICDTGNHRVHVYSTDGTWLRSYGDHADDGGTLYAPVSIAIDADGNCIVADLHDTALHVFDAAGEWVEDRVVLFEGAAAHPSHVRWMPDGRLYVRVASVHHQDFE